MTRFSVHLPVELTDRARADLRAPQYLSDVLHAADGHAGKVHFDQRLLDRALANLVSPDDLRLERERPQPWDGQLDLAGRRHQLSFVRARACVRRSGLRWYWPALHMASTSASGRLLIVSSTD